MMVSCCFGISAVISSSNFTRAWPGRVAPEADEFGSDSEDEGDGPEVVEQEGEAGHPVQLPAPDPETGLYEEAAIPKAAKDAHAIACIELVNAEKAEIKALEQEEQQPAVPEIETRDPASPFGGPLTEPLGGEPDHVPQTVGQILTAAGLRNFKPPKEDDDLKCLERVRLLAKPLRLLVRKVRLHDKILSRSQLCGKVVGKFCGKHHQFDSWICLKMFEVCFHVFSVILIYIILYYFQLFSFILFYFVHG